jgi:hypothetical protein
MKAGEAGHQDVPKVLHGSANLPLVARALKTPDEIHD